MTSIRKIESNKRNASRSTGPRTPGGKLRSRNNARRHGLATPLEYDFEAIKRIEGLTAILEEGGDNTSRQIEQSRVIAECYFDLRRIRAARHDVFATIHDLENATGRDFEIALRAMESIGRYERRALSKRRRALQKPLETR
jgi:hypothetical protein